MQESKVSFLSPVAVPERYPEVGILSAAAFDDHTFLDLFGPLFPSSLDALLLCVFEFSIMLIFYRSICRGKCL